MPGSKSGMDTSSEPHTQVDAVEINVKDPSEPQNRQMTRHAATEGSSHGFGPEYG